MPVLTTTSISPIPALDEVLTALDVGVLVQGPAAEIYFSNDAAPELLGLTMDQLLGRTSFDPTWNVIHPDGSDFPGPTHPVPRAIQSRAPVRNVVMGVYRPIHKDRVWLLVNAIPRLEEDGSIQYVICSFTNITTQHRLEEQLQAANGSLEQQVQERTEALQDSLDSLGKRERLYRSVFNALAEGAVVHDEHGVIIDANPSAAAVLGLTVDQLQGRTDVDTRWSLEEADSSPLDPESIPSRVSQRDGVRVRDRILAVRRPSGERVMLSVNSEPVFDSPSASEPSMVVATFNDITRQRKTQQALENSNARFRRITDTVPGMMLEGLWSDEVELTITFASGAARLNLGLHRESPLTWSTLRSRVHPAEQEKLQEAVTAIQDSLTPIDLQLRLLTEASPRAGRWFHLRAVAERQGSVGYIYALLLDVDDQIRLAETIREAQKREAIGELVAGVAHNFNNMLAAILPNIEEAVKEAPEGLRPQLEDAVAATRSAAELVRQLLLVTRSDSAIPHQPLDLRQLVHTALTIARRTFDVRIGLYHTLPDGPCWVTGNWSLLQQVLINLLINARDALVASHAPTITVNLAAHTLPGGEGWRLTVTDNGCGIDDATLSRLGEPFFTTKGPGKGTGLGLATAIGIAQEHGGLLTWSSVLGEGAVFWLDLPQGKRSPISHNLPAAPLTPLPADRRVLIIDDEALVRRGMRRLMRELDVIEAENGQEGIALFASEHQHLDAVLLDLSMPDLSGVEVLRALHACAPDVPVIIMSGHIQSEVGLEKAFAIAQKPLMHERLYELLRAAFAQAPGDAH